ncbi:DUF6804 family protein [Flagellimonas sp.]|uniref:DUF6804 family protein n=1 Tax=Flagellimonas sp. TaxID=2058762 RepID=UPI003C7EA1DC
MLVKSISLLCALLLFIAVMQLSREYYWLLRIVVFIGALLVFVKNRKYVVWAIIFALIAVLFNPIFPIYLYNKAYWIPLDIITGILFLIEAMLNRPKKSESMVVEKKKYKTLKRDRIL